MSWLRRLLRGEEQFVFWMLMPVILGAILIYVVTDIIYSGGRRENMAAMVEGFLIGNVLSQSAYDAQVKDKIIVVSATDEDYQRLPRAEVNALRDLSMQTYADVARIVAQAQPGFAIVNWLYYAQEETEEGLLPLVDAIGPLENKQQIVMVYPTKTFHAIPEGFGKALHVKEGNDCIYQKNYFCSYNKDWNFWLIQYLVDNLWPDIKKFHVSNNLPHKIPNFLLHLPRASSLTQYSFSDVLSGRLSPGKIRGQYVFIGNNMTQDERFAYSKYAIERTYTAHTDTGKNLIQSGVAFHVFWAQMAQMFVDGQTIAVPSRIYTWVILVIVSGIILITLIKIGPAASFATFLFYVVIYPVVNVGMVKILNVYIPMFDMIYGGLLTFLSSSFVFVSYTNYQSWRVKEMESAYQSTADLKANFISLISHNLNTPIAKLQGLVDILITKNNVDRGLVLGIRKKIAQIQVSVRSVLLLSAIEQKNFAKRPIVFKDLLSELRLTAGGVLKRYNLTGDLQSAQTLEDALYFATYNLDLRIINHLLAVLIVQFQSVRGNVGILIEADDATAGLIRISISLDEYLVPSQLLHLVRSTDWRLTDASHGECDFSFRIMNKFIQLVVEFYEGSYSIDTTDEGTYLQIELNCL